jgi:tetrahydromethanopterin S-methyltransferase subunit F
MAVSLVVSLILIAAGLGLLKMRPWGRTTSIVYAVLVIVSQVAQFVASTVYVNPIVDAWMADWTARHPGAEMPFGITTSPILGILGTLFGMVYAVVLLVFMLLPSIRQAFADADLPVEDEPPEPAESDDPDAEDQPT